MLRKRLKNSIIYFSIRGLLAVVNVLPRRFSMVLCGVLGVCVYICSASTRRRTIGNLQRAFGTEKSVSDIRHLAYGVFWDLGKNAVDVMRLSQITSENVDTLVYIKGQEFLEAAYAKGEGVIAVSGHIGNFELLGSYLALKGFNVTVVAAPLYDPRLDALLGANRVRGGLRIVHREHATSAVLRALRRGDVVGLLIDQDTRVHGTFVDFFGHPAYTPVGPAIIADRTGAPVVPMAIQRQADDTHLITIQPPIEWSKKGSKEDYIHAFVQQYTSIIEAFILQTPTQWVWMHDRWKTRPSTK